MNTIQPLRERDKQIVSNWYIAALGTELKEKPLRRIIYDTPLVLYRDNEGAVCVLLDRCLHRGAQLSLGNCQAGKIQCPYHGWIYDSTGEVKEIPSEGLELKSKHSRLKKFSVVEQDGAIWVWMGDKAPESPLPPWRFPFHQDKGWVSYFMITDFENEVTHLAENFMDVPHTVFVHQGWFRSRSQKHVPMSLDVAKGEVCVTYDQPKDDIGFTSLLMNPLNKKMTHTDRFIYPNITRVDYQFENSSAFIINSQITPVSTLRSRVYTYICYRIHNYGALLKPLMRYYTRQVITQDVEIMKNQGDNLKYFFDQSFRSTEADEVHLAIERLRRLGAEGKPELWTTSKSTQNQFWI